MYTTVLRPNFEKNEDGLLPVVAQDADSLEVLMVASTDEAGWRRTLETGIATYYSKSRKEMWIKGKTSNNHQAVVDVRTNCDGAAIVYLVRPQGHGVACHTNARSCFYRSSINGLLPSIPAPDAGEKEKLLLVHAEVHPDFYQEVKVV